jgi:hypothetical protein
VLFDISIRGWQRAVTFIAFFAKDKSFVVGVDKDGVSFDVFTGQYL